VECLRSRANPDTLTGAAVDGELSLEFRKLVAEVLDRVDQFPDFDPRRHYSLTLDEREMTPAERANIAAASVDEVELKV
jgi:hypothetical protein